LALNLREEFSFTRFYGQANRTTREHHKILRGAIVNGVNRTLLGGGDVNVYFTQEEKHSFSVNGPAKLVKAVKIKVKENTLFIEYKEPFLVGDDGDLTIYVTAPALTRIRVAGEADFESKNLFKGKDLLIKTRQNGEVSMKNVTATNLTLDAKGSSSIDLDYVNAASLRVSSQDRAEVEVSGSTGNFEVVKKGMFAEIDTEKLVTTQTADGNKTSGKATKDGGVEFTFND